MTDNEKAYWDKRDRIIDADFIWLAQRHVTNAIESLAERGYDKNSDTVRELQSIIDRLSKLAVTVQTGLEEEAYKKEDAKWDACIMSEPNAEEDHESETQYARNGF
jgi:hypothetical protein